MDYILIKKNILGITCLVITAVILIAGLWPFNFLSENKVRWLKDQNGLQFYGRGIVFSQHHALYPLLPLSIEILLQPGEETYDYTARILSLYDRKGTEKVVLSQWKSGLILQTEIQHQREEKYPKLGVKHVLLKGVKRLLTITSELDGVRIYVDGKLAAKSDKFNLHNQTGGPFVQLLLGNSAKGKQPWNGYFYGLAIFNHPLTEEQISKRFQWWSNGDEKSLLNDQTIISFYLFDPRSETLAHDHVGEYHLVIPSRFKALQKTFLVPPWEDFRLNPSYLKDTFTNFLGFIPFGFFFTAYLYAKKHRSIFQLVTISILMGAILSLFLELVQGHLPTRSSQLSDVIMNMLGTAFGAVIFHKLPQIIKRKS